MFSAKTEQIIQGFGGMQPLELRLGIKLLSEQCPSLLQGLPCISKLVQEQDVAIAAAVATTLATMTLLIEVQNEPSLSLRVRHWATDRSTGHSF